jgi:hypothetical protein
VIFGAGRVVQKAITYVGLDVHKDSIVASLAEAGLRGRLQEVREYGKALNTPAASKAMAPAAAIRRRKRQEKATIFCACYLKRRT